MRHDPIEDDPKIKSLIEAADKEANAELIDSEYRGRMGFCYIFWTTKKRILREKHGARDPGGRTRWR